MQTLKTISAVVMLYFLARHAYADVVIDVACSDPSQLRAISHQLTALKKSHAGRIIVSVRGQCVGIFSLHENKYPQERSRLELLSQLGVIFLLDEASLTELEINNATVAGFASVENDLLGQLIRLQEKDNYSYIHYAASAYRFADKRAFSRQNTKEKQLKFNW